MTEVFPSSAVAPRWRARRWLAGLAAAVLVCGVAGPAAAQPSDDALRDEIRELEQDQGRLEEESRERAADVDALERELAELRARRDAINAELQAATVEADAATAQVAQLSDAAHRLEGEVGALDAESDAVRDQLAGRIRALYTGQSTSGYASLLDAESTSELYIRQHYLQALARHDQDNLERAVAVRRALTARQEQLDAARRQAASAAEDATAAQRALEERFQEAAALERQVTSRVAALDAEAQRLAREADARRREVADAQGTLEGRERERQLAAAEEAEARAAEARAAQRRQEAASRAAPAPAPSPSPPPTPSPAPSPTPVAAAPAPAPAPVASPAPAPASPSPAQPPSPSPSPSPTPAQDSSPPPASGASACPQANPRAFSDTWGAPRSGGRTHQGTDIFGARGGQVYAITSGVVEFTRTGGNAGLWLSLRGDDGHRYWYMHLQDFVASGGQRVAAGELIAHNGDTGNARGTTPHIHFEWHPNGGSPTNPYPLLRQVCG